MFVVCCVLGVRGRWVFVGVSWRSGAQSLQRFGDERAPVVRRGRARPVSTARSHCDQYGDAGHWRLRGFLSGGGRKERASASSPEREQRIVCRAAHLAAAACDSTSPRPRSTRVASSTCLGVSQGADIAIDWVEVRREPRKSHDLCKERRIASRCAPGKGVGLRKQMVECVSSWYVVRV